MTERPRVREIDDDEGRRLARLIRRGSGPAVTWRVMGSQTSWPAAVAPVEVPAAQTRRDGPLGLTHLVAEVDLCPVVVAFLDQVDSYGIRLRLSVVGGRSAARFTVPYLRAKTGPVLGA